MSEAIDRLAQMIKTRRDTGTDKFVFMMGAGASMSSGVKPTHEIQEMLLEEHGADIVDGDVGERFDELWDRNQSNREIRDALLKPFLEGHQPSRGYKLLADLIAAGYFDVILNFNYDSLLNEALKAHPEVDVDHLIRGKDKDKEIEYSMQTDDPRVKHLKLHGSLKANDRFFFSAEEMNDYPKTFKLVVQHWTEKDIIVCGYAFKDDCVIKAFSSEGKREIFCVNPSLPPSLRGVMTARVGRDYKKNVIKGEMGKFDAFIEELYKRLEAPKRGKKDVKAVNPFKYFDAYTAEEGDWLLGRDELTQTVLGFLEDPAVSVVNLSGKAKVGKSSFVRAGVIGKLNPDHFKSVFIRCRSPVHQELLEQIAAAAGVDPDGLALEGALTALARSDQRRVVLVLDQFEKAFKSPAGKAQKLEDLVPLYRAIYDHKADNLVVVIVRKVDDFFFRVFAAMIANSPARAEKFVDGEKKESIERLPSEALGEILDGLAKKAHLEFDQGVFDDIQRRYAESKPGPKEFTLAHAQALCYQMAKDYKITQAEYERIRAREINALDQAINKHDVIGFVEDFPRRSQRMLLRNMLKEISPESKELIAALADEKDVGEICKQTFPEPI